MGPAPLSAHAETASLDPAAHWLAPLQCVESEVLGVESEVLGAVPGAFMARYMAFRQYVEMILQFVPSKTARTKPWRLLVRRAELVRDVITHFGDFSKMKVFQPTQVTFIDDNGNEEEGVDLGGLTEEMFSSFFSEVLPDDH